jgi:transcriptional regulator with PAS, ATPase and Fis domain
MQGNVFGPNFRRNGHWARGESRVLLIIGKGEVRELENVLERAVIFCDKEFIGLEHLPEYFRQMTSLHASLPSGGHQTLRDAVKAFERTYIEQVLAQHDRNKEATAQALGVSLSSLYRKMEELEIPTR